jgi:hypothetical protein
MQDAVKNVFYARLFEQNGVITDVTHLSTDDRFNTDVCMQQHCCGSVADLESGTHQVRLAAPGAVLLPRYSCAPRRAEDRE